MPVRYLKAAPGVIDLRLSQPERRNALSEELVIGLCEAFERAKDDAEVRTIVLSAEGKAFCAGGDLSSMQGRSGEGRLGDSFVALLESMHRVGKPVIAAVAKDAYGGGVGLVAACDIVIASSSSRFALSEIRVGLWPMMITAELVRNMGRKKVLELMLSGRRIDAAEAREAGLVTRLAEPEEVEDSALSMATTLAEYSPTAMKLGLNHFYAAQDLSYSEALRSLQGGLKELLTTEDALEGVSAFLQKRSPVWKGR